MTSRISLRVSRSAIAMLPGSRRSPNICLPSMAILLQANDTESPILGTHVPSAGPSPIRGLIAG